MKPVTPRQLNQRLALKWARLSLKFLPFADVATTELPMSRLLRLAGGPAPTLTAPGPSRP